MIRMLPTVSSAHCKDYFTSSLQPTQYFINKQELQGYVYGRVAERLNIVGVAERDVFFALTDNKNPHTGKSLTPRNKANRTIAYDISYFAPKSVSLISALCGDDHIIKIFQESVRETMKEMEQDMLTRVRKKGKDEDRHTGEMVISEFIHLTARPTDGSVSDPLLHAHNIIHNLTYDAIEGRYKAGQFREINRSVPFYQQKFHKRLADKLMALGYKIRKTRSAFEIEGCPDYLIEHFSKRSSAIGEFAKEHGITDAKALGQLGAKTRGKKQDVSMGVLTQEWRRQIREISSGKEDLESLVIRQKQRIVSPGRSPQEFVDYAAKHNFERLSTIAERRLLESAYRYAVGNNTVSIEQITEAFNQDKSFIRIQKGFQTICTKKEVLAEEKEMVILARNGQGRLPSLYSVLPIIGLDGQQRNAVAHVLTTSNMVSIIRGVAGAGKTTALTELDRHLKAAGKMPLYVAPTGQASRENLAKEGFANAETVARLLIDKKMQDSLQNQVLVVDEAGLIGTKDMRDLLALVSAKKARIVLVGDTRQHNSVSRGDALRILNTVGKIKSAGIDKIRRQRSEKYRSAVEDLSKGDVSSAFDKLDDIGAIHQIDPLNPNAELVSDYVAAVKKGKSTLIIAPTHQQGNIVTTEVRIALQDAGQLGKNEIVAPKFISLNLTEAQRGDWRNYQVGNVVQFNLPAPQIKRGSVWTISDIDKSTISMIDKSGNQQILPLEKAKAFDVYNSETISIAKGDKIRITKGGFDQQKKRLNNGQKFEVLAIGKSGDIKLINRESKSTYVVKSDFGNIDHAYCMTSHASQGATVDIVYLSAPGAAMNAIDSKLMYVSISRGRDMANIYTDDRERLLEQANCLGDRTSALELLSKANNDNCRRQQLIDSPDFYIERTSPILQDKTPVAERQLAYEP